MCDYLLKCKVSIQVMLCLIIERGIPFTLDLTSKAMNRITSLINSDAAWSANTYNLNNELYEITKAFKIGNFDPTDLGLNILLLSFSRYIARRKYELFFNHFRHITIYEKFITLVKSIDTSRCGLIFDQNYGLKANIHNFTNKWPITWSEFKAVVIAILDRKKSMQDLFYIARNYHVKIAESIYNLTTGCVDYHQMITECNRISRPYFVNYKFPTPIQTDVYTGDYWFIIPQKAIRFGYYNGFYAYSNYTESLHDLQMKAFDCLKCIVFGYIFENKIYPIHADVNGSNWTADIDTFKMCNFESCFADGRKFKPPRSKYTYYVRNGDNAIYKLNT